MAKTDPLARYNEKRDFAKTREPKGEHGTPGGNLFMVQKHDATRLHWDLRLEKDGVLKSWAVTRGPSPDPADKRLAVRTEDHPLSYATFEGTIPADQYGGGTVMLWDRGTWAPIAGKTADTLEEGHLHFTLDGERMKGEWLLVRIKGKPREKRENWLLRKIDDAHAGGSDELVATALTSVATGRTMDEIARGVTGKVRRSASESLPFVSSAVEKPGSKRGAGVSRLRSKRMGGDEEGAGTVRPEPKKSRAPAKAGAQEHRRKPHKLPAFQPPQLATLVDGVPAGSGWMHEVKYDGYRALVAVAGGAAKVFTRSGLDWTDRFPAVADAAAALNVGAALIDGEIVVLDGDGRPSFSALQAALKDDGGPMLMFAFDLLSLDGEDLRRLPNIERKERLRGLLAGLASDAPIQIAEHVLGAGEPLFATMCREGYEGIVSKRADAPYAGRRTQAWLKVKCTRRQEFVVVGWTESSAKARPFSSLLLALADEEGGLRYAGKVGTGFDADLLADLAARMARIGVGKPAVDVPRAAARGAHWVRPKLVAEVAFAEFTAENVVRHASFVGLREDKATKEAKAERPKPAPKATAVPSVSNPDRVIFPDNGLTKGDLAAYVAAVAPLMLADAADRPISLVRCPQGRARHCFFQKHDAGSFGDRVSHVDIREKDGSVEPYLYVSDTDGLIACVQMGTIEIHGWGSRVADVEKPDRMIFDLDPDEGLGFAAVKSAAFDLRDHLADIGLVSFPLLSGGKGVHVVVPLTPAAGWPAVKDFAQRFSIALSAAEPERFVATMSKAKRKGRIFIDWLRNQRGATAILPYSARARPGAPVAAPVSWEELRDLDTPARFTIQDADELLARAGSDGLKGWGRAEQVLPDL